MRYQDGVSFKKSRLNLCSGDTRSRSAKINLEKWHTSVISWWECQQRCTFVRHPNRSSCIGQPNRFSAHSSLSQVNQMGGWWLASLPGSTLVFDTFCIFRMFRTSFSTYKLYGAKSRFSSLGHALVITPVSWIAFKRLTDFICIYFFLPIHLKILFVDVGG